MEAASSSASASRAITPASHTPSTAARSSDVEKEDIEENLSAIIGRTGLFHRALFAYEVVAMLCFALHNLVHGASASDEDHWCRLPDPPGNTTLEEWRDMNIPRDENGNMSRCLVYSLPDGEVTAGNEMRAAVPCSARVFGNSGAMSVVKQWDLTCDRLWIRSACETVYTSGSFFGLVLSGITADK